MRRRIGRLSRPAPPLSAAAAALALLQPVQAQEQEGAGEPAAVVEMTSSLDYEPREVTIQVGQAVRWKDASGMVHTVTADPSKARQPDEHVELPEGAQPFDSGDIAAGASWSYTFTVPGRYEYFCIPHERAGMVGVVIVEPKQDQRAGEAGSPPDGGSADAGGGAGDRRRAQQPAGDDAEAHDDRGAQEQPSEDADDTPGAGGDHAHAHGSRDGADADDDRPLPAGTVAAPAAPRPAVINWLGRFHPPSINFPIGLLLAAVVAEGLFMATKREWFAHATRFCVWGGAVGGLGAGILGWFFAGFRLADPTWILTTHRWLGTGAVVWSLGLLALMEWTIRPDPPRPRGPFRVALLIAAVLVGLNGHFGGLMVYGLDHYQWPA